MPRSAASAPERPVESDSRPLAADVRDGLSRPRKQLSARWLYDDLGSALFEAICRLPWYRITRSEMALLGRAAPALAERFPQAAALAELGPGGGEKLAVIVEAFTRRGLAPDVHLVDISAHALSLASRSLARFRRVRVRRHEATFGDGLAGIRRLPGRRLVAFLGSNIGNFDAVEARRLAAEIASAVDPDDGFLLGADLVKPEKDLQLAYDDPIGVTAAFNRNVLARINRELDANFDVAAFRHEARWNAAASRMEMHLVSTRVQDVRIPGAGLRVAFSVGESIWTESSYKFEPEALKALWASVGLRVLDQWIDEEARFALMLFGR